MSEEKLQEQAEQIALLQQVVRITRDQLGRSMALCTELEGMLILEKEKVANLRSGNFEPRAPQTEQPS